MSADAQPVSLSSFGPPTGPAGAIPRWIHRLRARTGLTQEKFAARLGVTCLTINRWENGRTKPSPLALKQLHGLALELEPGDEADAAFSEPPLDNVLLPTG